MTSRHSGLPRIQCAFIRIKPENKYFWRAELILKLTKAVLFTYFESSSYSLCTKRVWFKAVFKVQGSVMVHFISLVVLYTDTQRMAPFCLFCPPMSLKKRLGFKLNKLLLDFLLKLKSTFVAFWSKLKDKHLCQENIFLHSLSKYYSVVINFVIQTQGRTLRLRIHIRTKSQCA